MDTTKYINNANYINVKTVESMPPDQRLFIITGEGEERIFKNKQGLDDPKPQIPLCHFGMDRKEYVWTLGYRALLDLCAEFDSADTKKWVGAKIKLILQPTKQGSQTVTATVISKPMTQGN